MASGARLSPPQFSPHPQEELKSLGVMAPAGDTSELVGCAAAPRGRRNPGPSQRGAPSAAPPACRSRTCAPCWRSALLRARAEAYARCMGRPKLHEMSEEQMAAELEALFYTVPAEGEKFQLEAALLNARADGWSNINRS